MNFASLSMMLQCVEDTMKCLTARSATRVLNSKKAQWCRQRKLGLMQGKAWTLLMECTSMGLRHFINSKMHPKRSMFLSTKNERRWATSWETPLTKQLITALSRTRCHRKIWMMPDKWISLTTILEINHLKTTLWINHKILLLKHELYLSKYSIQIN